jgi:hypothetical protein
MDMSKKYFVIVGNTVGFSADWFINITEEAAEMIRGKRTDDELFRYTCKDMECSEYNKIVYFNEDYYMCTTKLGEYVFLVQEMNEGETYEEAVTIGYITVRELMEICK